MHARQSRGIRTHMRALCITTGAIMKVLVAAGAGVAILIVLQQWRKRRRKPLTSDVRTLRASAVPMRLAPHFYFDFEAAASRGCEHVGYLRSATDVSAALDGLHSYVVGLLRQLGADGCLEAFPEITCGKPASFRPEHVLSSPTGREPPPRLLVGDGACIDGGTFDLSGGSIYIGAEATVEHGAYVRGPAYISRGCVIRHGAYIRGDVAIGAGCIVGGELKHLLTLDECELPHYGYAGDSLLGYKAHFGCGSVTANFPLFPTSAPAVEVEPGHTVLLGRRKFGAVVGDSAQLGCGSVTEPGCLLAPHTVCYPNSRLARGVYGPRELLKNRPTIERAPLRV